MAVQMYRNDRPGSWRDCTPNLLRIDAKSIRFDVDWYRHSARVGNRVCRCNEREIRDDDFVSRTYSDRLQGQVQPGGPITRRERVLDATVAGKGFFECLDIASERRHPSRP